MASSPRSSCKRHACMLPTICVLAAAIAAGRPFEWMKWLPHLRASAPTRRAPRSPGHGSTPTGSSRLLLEIAASARTPAMPNAPHVLAILDAGARSATPAAHRVAPGGRSGRAHRRGLDRERGGRRRRTMRASVLDVGPSSRLWSAPIRGRSDRCGRRAGDRRAIARTSGASAGTGDATSQAGDRAGIARDVSLVDVLGRGATSERHVGAMVAAIGRVRPALPDRHRRRRTGRDRPRRGRPPHVDRRHDRVGQERVVAVGGHRDRRSLLAAAGQLPVRRLQGRRGHEGVRTTYRTQWAMSPTSTRPLARRAIVSLRAELERRMALLEGRAKDLRGLVAPAPDGGAGRRC